MEDDTDKLRARVDQGRVTFLKTDLRLCVSFSGLAAARLTMGNRESAEQAIAHAEKGYETISRFLSDPKHVSHLTADQVRDFKAELHRVRERLDGLQARRRSVTLAPSKGRSAAHLLLR
jgi:hypothetical protein